ncbi:MAG: PEP-CTERM sorting domain-containing protein [Lacipirellulaceae bacterium]
MTSRWFRFAARFVAAAPMVAAASAIAAPQTVVFQNGLNGYTGTFQRRLADTNPATEEFNGSTVADFFVDGYQPDGTDANTLPDSNDQQMLIRFDSMFGAGANRIPLGATILDAKFTTTTSLRGNAQTAGPFGISGLVAPFDDTVSYFTSFNSTTNFVSRGPWYQDGSATRATGGWGFQNPGEANAANVTSLVQGWSNGGAAHGFTIQAGISDDIAANANTADGWAINSIGYPVADQRPRLAVTYTTNPIVQKVFQRDLNEYVGDSMFVVRSGPNTLIRDLDPITGLPATDPVTGLALERTEDGTTLDQTFLDGPLFSLPDGTTSSPDDFGVFKFGNVFGAGSSQAPAGTPVAKAWLVITTGDANANANSQGPWVAHPLLRAIDTNTLHSAIGGVGGVQVTDADLGAELSRLEGMIRGSEVWFDVTRHLEAVRSGAIVDNGIAVLANGTADGWQIHANGSLTPSARPRLVVYSGDLGIVAGLSGDFNDDGVVNAGDYTTWRDNLGTTFSLNGNGNEAGPSGGVVDQADYDLWAANYGASNVGALANAVPEPAAAALVAVAAIGFAARRRD